MFHNAIALRVFAGAPLSRRFIHGIGLLALAMMLLVVPEISWAHGMSEEEKQAIIDGGNMSFLWLGITHMLSGYDHLAFVFGIIFFLTNFRDIAKYVTAFTLGHSVTLIFATYQGIQLDYYLIDAFIAFSVCYIAFSNLDGFKKYFGVQPPNMLMMILGLGLIHGFGLSSRLQELPLDADNLLMNIITFNIGIELGQLIALVGMLVVINIWRKQESFKPFSVMANVALILLGTFLFSMQMHGYSHADDPKTEQVASTEVSEISNPDDDWQQSLTVSIPARGEKEFKLVVAKDKGFEYRWSSDGAELYYDLHGEPSGDDSGFFQSYEVDTRTTAEGAVKAPFDGTHGWYWKNTSNQNVTISLQLRGEFEIK